MKFEEFMTKLREEVDAFEREYKKGMEQQGEETYLDEMDEPEWFEQFQSWIYR